MCTVCDYWYFNHGFKFHKPVCNSCHDLMILCLDISDITIITIKGIDYSCIIHYIIIMIEGIYKMHFKEINIKIEYTTIIFYI